MKEKVVIVESKKVCIAGEGCGCKICVQKEIDYTLAWAADKEKKWAYEAAMKKVFGAFYQARKEAVKYYEGIGMSWEEAQEAANKEVLRFIAMYSPVQPSKIIGGR